MYDVWAGVVIVARLLFLLVLLVAIRYSLQLYTALNQQDGDIDSGEKSDAIKLLATSIQKFIIFVIGYRGEKRERTPLSGVDTTWMRDNKYFVFRRFVLFYCIYITFGILLTRPLYNQDASLVFYNYDRQNLNAIFYLLVYIFSNAITDYISIFYTFRHLRKISETGKIFRYGTIDMFVATIVFAPNQLISCVLWYYKRSENNIELSEDLFSTIFDLALWPYALVGNLESGTMIGQPFPGQLIITGTVFFPTIALITVLLVYRIFLTFAYWVKRALIRMGIDEFCRKYVQLVSLSPFQTPQPAGFGYCNAALIIIFNSILLSMVYDNGKAVFNSFAG
ncbi:MAG: hypothetical protein QNJ44_05110 [Rhodobacter sp.]|nr:hypothetical protein [Rhodobacter sp.]